MPERNLSRTRSPCTWESLNGHWMAVGRKYLYSSSVGLHIVALIPTRQYFSWFDFSWLEWNIESENLPDEVMNLWIFTIWLTSSGCRPHTSSVWPWSGTPKVHLYNTFLGGLGHTPSCLVSGGISLSPKWSSSAPSYTASKTTRMDSLPQLISSSLLLLS